MKEHAGVGRHLQRLSVSARGTRQQRMEMDCATRRDGVAQGIAHGFTAEEGVRGVAGVKTVAVYLSAATAAIIWATVTFFAS